MTDKRNCIVARQSHSRRGWAMLAVSVTVVLHGIVGFPGVPGTDINYAVAQGECDPQCWACGCRKLGRGR